MEGRFSTSNAVGIAANFHEACRLSSSLPHPPTDVAQNNTDAGSRTATAWYDDDGTYLMQGLGLVE